MAKSKTEVSLKDINKLAAEFLITTERDEDGNMITPRYKTDLLAIDDFLGGGIPKGKVISIGAEEGAGKSTLVIQMVGNIVEKYNKKAVYIDAEGGLAIELIESMGYGDLIWHPQNNPDGPIYIMDASTIQEINRIIKLFTSYPDTAVIVIDSTKGVFDASNLDSDELGASNKAVGKSARMWSANVNELAYLIKHSEACMIMIHQARTDLSGFMPKVVSATNKALKHLTTAELWGKVRQYIDKDNVLSNSKATAIGSLLELSVSKNKLGIPFRKIEIPLYFGKGVSNKWAYRRWLEDNSFVDYATGEIIQYLKMAGGGYFTLTLPSGTYKARGYAASWDLFEEHLEEVLALIEASGGITSQAMTDEELREVDKALLNDR